jgi:hypothetical protein
MKLAAHVLVLCGLTWMSPGCPSLSTDQSLPGTYTITHHKTTHDTVSHIHNSTKDQHRPQTPVRPYTRYSTLL